MRLEGASAVVTGGASGIGRATAIELAREGADVAVGDLRRAPREATEPTDAAVEATGSDALFRETDVADPAQAEALVEAAADAFGGLDVLVNNAGIARRGAVESVSPADWRRTLEVNLSGVYHCSRPSVAHLRESDRARIVNVASQLGLVGRESMAAYCASKGGVVNLTRAMAMDYAGERITVNAVCPGVVETALSRPTLEDEEGRAFLEERTPLPFFGRPEDAARAVVYLAAESGRYVTGHCLTVDGGWTAR